MAYPIVERAMAEQSYGIKIVTESHFDGNWPCFFDYFRDGNAQRPLMNFKKQQAAESLPEGHHALVYVSGWQRFVWAIEFLEVVDPKEYESKLLAPHGLSRSDLGEPWKFLRPFRYLARMNDVNGYEAAPTLDWARKLLNDPIWQPTYGVGHVNIEKTRYDTLFDNIPWDWTAKSGTLPTAATPGLMPPIRDAEALLALVKTNNNEGYPEANTRRLVEKFFLALGHSEKRIVFEVGRIDISVDDTGGKRWAVVEVKRSLADKGVMAQARRQGFDYAGKVGARWVVITDANKYEVYDRRKGDDYDSQHCGSFQLTHYTSEMESVLNLLRPSGV